jgi:8-oxo-dGTP diphosphatase
MVNQNQKPLVGVALIVLRNKEDVLLGKRKGSHEVGRWCFPGGDLEYYEAAREIALGELFEGTGLTDRNVRLIDEHPWRITEDFFPHLHGLTLYLRAEHLSGTPEVKEPERYGEWRWYSWNKVPTSNLFLPVKNLISLGYNPFEK